MLNASLLRCHNKLPVICKRTFSQNGSPLCVAPYWIVLPLMHIYVNEWVSSRAFWEKERWANSIFPVGDEQLLKQNPNCAIIPLCGRTKDITILSTLILIRSSFKWNLCGKNTGKRKLMHTFIYRLKFIIFSTLKKLRFWYLFFYKC